MNKNISVPFTNDDYLSLKSGDYVYLTGTLYTARDAAHKRMYEAMKNRDELPVDLKGNILYYLGPSPSREGQVIGSAGPTTSSRMDRYTPDMFLQEQRLDRMFLLPTKWNRYIRERFLP